MAGDYDYKSAIEAGMKPVKGHWGSRVPSGPKEGLILKSRRHPTFHKTVAGEKKLNYDFIVKKGRVYSFPKDIVQRLKQRELRGRARGEPPRR